MFIAKRIQVDASSMLIAVISKSDAKELSLHAGERVKITTFKNSKGVICILDVIDSDKKKNIYNIKSGEIGIFESAYDKLNISKKDKVNIFPAPKPHSLKYVNEKFAGVKLNEHKFLEIMRDIVDNVYSQIETTYFVLACTIHKLDDKETIALTKAMVNVGKVLDFGDKNKIVVDKHCIGGLAGNRTSMVLVPIVAAAGLTIPKSSSRAITSPAGTADTMEVLCNVEVPLSEMTHIVKEIGGCIVWGGALDLSPADDLIIHVEHPLEIDSEGQMIASILSKKKSVGSTHVLIDIPVGPTAKISDNSDAKRLKKRFERISNAIGLKVKVIITDAYEPIGRGIGPLYEAEDVIKVLKNSSDAPKDLREKSLMMAGEIFELAGIVKKGKGYNLAQELLVSKKAYEKFEQILDAQGRNKEKIEAKYTLEFKSKISGKVKSINNKSISKLAFILGAPEEKAAGLILHKRLNDKVLEGEILFEMFSNSKLKLKYANVFLEEHLDIFLVK